jgi:hypothetical protein
LYSQLLATSHISTGGGLLKAPLLLMKVPLKFKNKKAILFATGPTLKKSEIDFIGKNRTDDFVIFGCNDTYRYIDYLDVHYACDKQWWQHWGSKFRDQYPDLESWTQDSHMALKYKLNHVDGKGHEGLSLNSNLIHFGSNSGFQQLNLAFLMGCSEFYLVGYTMGKVDKQSHIFGEHPGSLKKNSPYPKFVQKFKNIQKEIKPLIHCSTTGSRLKGIFQHTSVEEIFNA